MLVAIVTYEFYTDTYLGETIDAAEFQRYELAAERVINQITYGRAAKYTALPIYQQEAIKTAICAQCEYYALYGIDLAAAGRQDSSFAVGKVRIDGSPANATGARSMISPNSVAILEQTGLLNPAVQTVGPAAVPMGWGWM